VNITELQVPKDVQRVVTRLTEAGHDAYVVGGCVRDAIRGVDPQDWDIATDATPDEIQQLFAKSLYTNRFGTVVVRSGDHEVEVTTYRTETGYTDHRRPDHVAFTDSLHEDLSRRDFTMNAMAWRPGKNGAPGELVDGDAEQHRDHGGEPAHHQQAVEEAHAGVEDPLPRHRAQHRGHDEREQEHGARIVVSLRDLGDHHQRARIHHLSVRGDDPVWMLTGPIRATQHALERTCMSIDDIDLFECNEAFASVVLAWADELEAAARSEDYRERAAAFRAVGQFRFRQKEELLRRGLEDGSPACRGSALLSLELLSRGTWSGAGVLGPEAFDAVPFLDLLTEYGSPWGQQELDPA